MYLHNSIHVSHLNLIALIALKKRKKKKEKKFFLYSFKYLNLIYSKNLEFEPRTSLEMEKKKKVRQTLGF